MTEEELNRLEAVVRKRAALGDIDPEPSLSLIALARVGLVAEAVKADIWDEAMEAAANLIGKGDDGYDWSKYGGEKAIRALVNPYRGIFAVPKPGGKA